MELKDELKKFEQELSVLVARFLKIYDEIAKDEETQERVAAPAERKHEPVALGSGFTTDFLTAYV